MKKIAFKPHETRGREIIKILENRGFRNPSKYDGNYSENITKDHAFIGGCDGAEDCIILTDIVYLENIGYKICTLEEYENEYKTTEIMSRLEMLKWCFENLLESEKSLEYITSTIGLTYAYELEIMNFAYKWYNPKEECLMFGLTDLGKTYCKEIFS